jgi:RND family efflux transporter MFP subunit
MSDRLIISLATIPMLSGVFLVALLDRPAAIAAHVAARPAARALRAPPEGKPEDAWIGVVSAGNNAELAAEFEGRVTHVWLHAGEVVKEGDRLLEIDRSDVSTTISVAGAELGQRKSDALRAEARLDAARTRMKRLETGGNWLSAQELDGARTELRMAQADVAAANAAIAMGQARLSQQRVRAERHRIVAPFSGRLVSVEVDPGDSVAQGQLLARVISDERVIRFALPRAALTEDAPQQVLVRIKGQERALLAKVASVRPEVDAAAQLVFASAALPDEVRESPSWIPGTLVEVLPFVSDEQIELER